MILEITVMFQHENRSEQSSAFPACFRFDTDKRIGRDAGCDITLPCTEKTVSRHHADILRRGEQYFIIDRSTNGTFRANSKTLLSSNQLFEIKHGDEFSIGQYRLMCKLASHPLDSSTGDPSNQTPLDLGYDSPNSLVLGEESPGEESLREEKPREENSSAPFEPNFLAACSLQKSVHPPQALPPEMPALNPAVAVASSGNAILAQSAGAIPVTGSIRDVFKPPKTYIPEDWASATLTGTKPLNPALSGEHPKGENNSKTNLTSASRSDTAASVLKTLLTSLVDLSQSTQAQLTSLCSDEQALTRAGANNLHHNNLQNNSLLNNASVESIFQQLLQDDSTHQRQAVMKLVQEISQIKQDLAVLTDCLSTCFDRFTTALDPDQFEQAFQENEALTPGSASSFKRALLAPRAEHRRWQFFRNTWQHQTQAIVGELQKQLQCRLITQRAEVKDYPDRSTKHS
jgi:predicted component of type VI protein secretion system